MARKRTKAADALNPVIQDSVPVGSVRDNGTQVLDLPAHIDADDVERLQAEAAERDPSGGRILASDIIDGALPEPEIIAPILVVDAKAAWRSKLREAWTPEKKAALAEKLRAKYASGEIVHPMKGKTLSEQTKENIRNALKGRPALGICSVCGRPLTEKGAAAKGVGPICEHKTMGVTVNGSKLHESSEDEE